MSALSVFSIEEFLKDENSMKIGELRDKYEGSIPKGTLIEACVEEIKRKNIEDLIIDRVWPAGDQIKKVHFCLATDHGYEVFVAERGNKAWLEKYKKFEKAAAAKLDLLFNELGYCAPDTMIK